MVQRIFTMYEQTDESIKADFEETADVSAILSHMSTMTNGPLKSALADSLYRLIAETPIPSDLKANCLYGCALAHSSASPDRARGMLREAVRLGGGHALGLARVCVALRELDLLTEELKVLVKSSQQDLWPVITFLLEEDLLDLGEWLMNSVVLNGPPEGFETVIVKFYIPYILRLTSDEDFLEGAELIARISEAYHVDGKTEFWAKSFNVLGAKVMQIDTTLGRRLFQVSLRFAQNSLEALRGLTIALVSSGEQQKVLDILTPRIQMLDLPLLILGLLASKEAVPYLERLASVLNVSKEDLLGLSDNIEFGALVSVTRCLLDMDSLKCVVDDCNRLLAAGERQTFERQNLIWIQDCTYNIAIAAGGHKEQIDFLRISRAVSELLGDQKCHAHTCTYLMATAWLQRAKYPEEVQAKKRFKKGCPGLMELINCLAELTRLRLENHEESMVNMMALDARLRIAQIEATMSPGELEDILGERMGLLFDPIDFLQTLRQNRKMDKQLWQSLSWLSRELGALTVATFCLDHLLKHMELSATETCAVLRTLIDVAPSKERAFTYYTYLADFVQSSSNVDVMWAVASSWSLGCASTEAEDAIKWMQLSLRLAQHNPAYVCVMRRVLAGLFPAQ